MGQPAAKLMRAAQSVDARLAGRDTPFLMNAWYVAGFAHEFDRSLRARTLLGRALVLFRGLDGSPRAMDDRCVHRSFPLSKSRLDGDVIICGYHGLRYDASGECVHIPGQATPQGVGVRSYPLRQAGSLVWIWMGDQEPVADLPVGDWVGDPAWPCSTGNFHLKASYIALHENLLDLTHLSFLHADTFGTPDYALAPYQVEIDRDAGRFSVLRSVYPTTLPPIWAQPTGITGDNAARIARSDFLSPALHQVSVRFENLDLPETDRPELMIRTAHLPTPETASSTHYFIHHGRNFGLGDQAMTDFMHEQLFAAFQEDVDGLQAVEATIARTPPQERYEISIVADRPALAMRRWLARRIEREAL